MLQLNEHKLFIFVLFLCYETVYKGCRLFKKINHPVEHIYVFKNQIIRF